MSRPRTRRARTAPGRARSPLAVILLEVLLTMVLGGLTGGPAIAETTPAPTPAPQPQTPQPETPQPETPAEVPADPLAVSIHSLTPSALPIDGRVVVTGNVRNNSDTEWTDLSVYLVVSGAPLTTEAQLVEAVASDPRTDVGDRVVAPGLFADIPDLAPGEWTGYRLSVPTTALAVTGEPGVYWLAVHVLGTSERGRLEGADGRARTFLPLVPEGNAGTELALGLQARTRVERAPSGRLDKEDRWRRSFGEQGALARVVELAAEAAVEDWPLTWVVDPAVVDAAISMSRGNPPLDLVRTADGTVEGGGDPEVPEGDEGAEPPGDDADQRSTGARRAEQWLEAFAAQTRDRPVLAVPYADPDLSAASDAGSWGLVEDAFGLGQGLLKELDIASSPAVAPLDGDLADRSLTRLDPEVTAVLSPEAVGELDAEVEPVLAQEDGGRVLLAPTADGVLGPGPNDRRAALAVRQRILADAALHALSEERTQPLVRLLPASWNPGPAWQRADFFDGLDVPWLRATSLVDLLDGAGEDAATLPEADATEPEELRELPPANFRAAEALISAGVDLEQLLAVNDVFAEEVTRQALTSVSQWMRDRPWLAAQRARLAGEIVRGWLERVSVRSPSFVTMSSESGTFQVTLVNELDQPVTVGLRASVVGDDLEVSSPEPVEIAPQGRRAVRIDVVATDIGVHEVTLQPVSAHGTPVGEATTLSVRSSRVGFILWIVMAVGGGLLFVAVVVRIWRRIRQRRRTHGPVLSRQGGDTQGGDQRTDLGSR